LVPAPDGGDDSAAWSSRTKHSGYCPDDSGIEIEAKIQNQDIGFAAEGREAVNNGNYCLTFRPLNQSPRVTIIDFDLGNLFSVAQARLAPINEAAAAGTPSVGMNAGRTLRLSVKQLGSRPRGH
jgi:hypothetical protein